VVSARMLASRRIRLIGLSPRREKQSSTGI
jgi:hypothetical protein